MAFFTICKSISIYKTRSDYPFFAQIEFFYHLLILLSVLQLYQFVNTRDRKLLIWLVIAYIGLLLNDLAFDIVVYLPNNYSKISLITFLIDIIPHSLWMICLMVFLSCLLIQYIFKIKKFLKIFFFDWY